MSSRPLPSTSSWAAGTATTRMRIPSFTGSFIPAGECSDASAALRRSMLSPSKGRAEADPSIRHALYRQAEEIIAREALLIPLFHEQIYRFAARRWRASRSGSRIPASRSRTFR